MVVALCVGGASASSAPSGISSAEFNENKVLYNGEELDLSSQPMISVVNEGEVYFSNYMPVRAVLERMGYKVDWDDETNTVMVSDGDWYLPDDIYAEGMTLRDYLISGGINFDRIYNSRLLDTIRAMCEEVGDGGFVSRLPEDILIVMLLDDFAGYAYGYNSMFGELWNDLFAQQPDADDLGE